MDASLLSSPSSAVTAADQHSSSQLQLLLASEYYNDPCEYAGDALIREPRLLPFEQLMVAINRWMLTMHGQQRRIDHAWICFRRYTDEDSVSANSFCSVLGLFSCLGQCYSEEYKHVELAFLVKDGSSGIYASHVLAWTVDMRGSASAESGRVRCILRNPTTCYNSDRWITFRLKLSQQEVLGLFLYCARQAGKPMNEAGLYWNFLPLLRWWGTGESRCEEQSYFCSQLVCGALKWIRPRQYSALEPRQCTPLALFSMLSADDAISESCAFRMM